MDKFNIDIKYLDNSSFKLETKDHILIFDYYLENGSIGPLDFTPGKNVIVLCSHGHSDHFNKVIFKWTNFQPNIKYILSNDIHTDDKLQNIFFMKPYDECEIDGVTIKAYGSTDLGVSFLLSFDGVSVFHAGDLNWWHWYDESDEDNKNSEIRFKSEILNMRNEIIDIAFFPVDSRLKKAYKLGADYFIKELKPRFFIPMHFREDFNITNEFANISESKATKIFAIREKGQVINIKL